MNPDSPQPQVADHKDSPSVLIEQNETVLAIVRRHWMGQFAIILVSFSALVSLLVLAVVLGADSSSGMDHTTYAFVMGAGVLVVGILMFMLFIVTFIYGQSRLTITDKSLVQVIQNSLFSRKVARLSMSNVEDVSVQQSGLLQTLFGYGTLTVQTAGEEDNFIFALCPKPNKYAEVILEARQSYALKHPAD